MINKVYLIIKEVLYYLIYVFILSEMYILESFDVKLSLPVLTIGAISQFLFRNLLYYKSNFTTNAHSMYNFPPTLSNFEPPVCHLG